MEVVNIANKLADRNWSRRDFLAGASATLVAAGVVPVVADETKRNADVAWLEEIQRAPQKPVAPAPDLRPVLLDESGATIASPSAWNRRREELRKIWSDFIGELKLPAPPNAFEVLEEDRPDGCVRQLIRYESEPGLPVEAYLLKPRDILGRVPAVVAMHSTVDQTIRQPAGLEGDEEDFFGLKLARRGYVAICPRCFLWQGAGSYDEHVASFFARRPGAKGMAKMLWDARRALDVAADLPFVDADRLGAIGHSLGAKEALYLSAFDERVKVAVSSEGGIGTTFSNWDAPWYLGPDIRPGGFGREHHELVALTAPRAFLLLGGDSADGAASWPYIEAAMPAYRIFSSICRVGLFNHGAGHSVPPEAEKRLYEWFDAYL